MPRIQRFILGPLVSLNRRLRARSAIRSQRFILGPLVSLNRRLRGWSCVDDWSQLTHFIYFLQNPLITDDSRFVIFEVYFSHLINGRLGEYSTNCTFPQLMWLRCFCYNFCFRWLPLTLRLGGHNWFYFFTFVGVWGQLHACIAILLVCLIIWRVSLWGSVGGWWDHLQWYKLRLSQMTEVGLSPVFILFRARPKVL